MAEMDEFKFPDELNEPITLGGDDNEFDIEVEDDTPEEDRGRSASDPDKVKQLEIEVDDLDKYSKDAKDKLIKMKRVWHDERRAKEQALREQQAAFEAAQALLEENKRIKAMLESGSKDYKDAIEQAAELKLKAAEKAYKAAHEAGDTEALLEAQKAMNKALRKMEKAKEFKLPPLQNDNFQVQQSQQVQQVPQPDQRVMRWQQENPWFGQDKEMTAAALGLHEKLRDQGVVVGSEDYYAALDNTMRRRFSDYFGDADSTTPQKADKPKTRSATNVAPATRSTAPKKVVLKKSQVALIQKLGITPEQYVREFLKVGS